MTSSRTPRHLAAWTVPVVTAAAVSVAFALPSTASASAHPKLPAKTPAQLLVAVETAGSTVSALSGTIVQTARLGLPELPGADNASSLSPQSLVTGTHTARVWLDGPEKQRLAMLGQLSESDLVHNGRNVWTYDSSTLKVGHTMLPAEKLPAAKAEAPDTTPDVRTLTPQGAAAEALKSIDPSTAVTVDRTARVAGRPAYTLVLTPRDSRSTVSRVLIAIDAQRSVPLRVQVFGRAARPAFEIAFTNVSFAKPAASVFRFTAPRGATVTQDLLASNNAKTGRSPASRPAAPKPGTPAVNAGTKPATKVLGTGWASVLEIAAPTDGSSPLIGLSGGNANLLNKLTTTLPNGDRLLSTALVNVLVTHDGRTFVGAVTPALLQQAAAGTLG